MNMCDAVLQKRLAWALLVLLLSTLVCYQPIELFHKFSNFTPPPQIWSVRGHRFQYSLVGHSNWVRKAVWSPDARLIASGGWGVYNNTI